MVLKFGFIMITGYMETYNGQILLPISTLLKDAIVSSLIDPDTRWWNSAIVDLNFLPF